jgi:shikimate dehydrogenase
MIKTGVIGHPIHHSKSPLIHNYWMEKHGIEGTYEAIDIAPNELQERIQGLVAEGYAGFNVTVPHKEDIFKLCDQLDDAAKAIGAVNTVMIKDGKLIGRNTDAFGFIENVKTNALDFKFDGKNVAVLGAGGAARAIVFGVQNEGAAHVHIFNRSLDKAQALAGDMQDAQACPWDKRHDLASYDMLINTTSLGMAGQPTLDIELDALDQSALVTDIVYAPLMTDLLRDAQRRGHPIVTGIGMLLHQARPAFKAWHGVMPQVDEDLERRVLE